MSSSAETGEPELTKKNLSSDVTSTSRKFASDLLSRVWVQSLPLVRNRIASLQDSARIACDRELTAEERTSAADLAHKLAGSLGMFGIPDGTRIAREMEQMLEAQSDLNVEHYAQLAARLHQLVAT